MRDFEAFTLYAMEHEGDIPTREGKIERVIRILATSCDPSDEEIQMRAFNEVGLDPYGLTRKENDYIVREVNRRWR